MHVKRIAMLFVISFFLVACSEGTKSKENLGEIVRIALNSIMEMDQALNHDITFIAIDMRSFSDLDDQDKADIVTDFKEKYNMEVMEATFEELEEKGLYNLDTLALDGVLLSIEKITYKSSKTIILDGVKFRSGKGAIGVECTVHYVDGNWKIKESKETWIS